MRDEGRGWKMERLVPLLQRLPLGRAPLKSTLEVIRHTSSSGPCGSLCSVQNRTEPSRVQEPSQEHC
jgi:hypothetical protein